MNVSRRLRDAAILALSVACMITVACGASCRKVSPDEFRQEWKLSGRDSAVSWWFAGERDDYYYFVTKYPQDYGIKDRIRVRRDAVRLVGVPKLRLTSDANAWFNLKEANIVIDGR